MTTRGFRRALWSLGAVLMCATASCNTQPATVVLPTVEVVIASGDGQFGVIGQELGSPLRVAVRSKSTGSPQEGLVVLWAVDQGDAELVGAPNTVTDSTGSTEIGIRMGATPGEVTVRATISTQESAETMFRLFSVGQPTLDEVAPTSAAAGDTITLIGTNFSPVVEQDVVLFSGVRARVVSASQTALQVEVPLCLPVRDVDVRVQLGVVASGSGALTVTGGGQVTTLQVGQVLDVADDGGYECFALQGGIAVAYLALTYSASTVGAATHPYDLTALSSAGPQPAGAPARVDEGDERASPVAKDPQAAWDEHLRVLERELIRGRAGAADGASGPALVGPAGVPSVGDRRTFQVRNSVGTFTPVRAVARYVGAAAAIFVDENAPSGGFEAADLQLFAARFDQVIHPEVTARFGQTSDLDANERVVILFTPVVNALTPRGSSGFVGGFFYGADLLAGSAGSNGGEIFYALVPDSGGQFSDRRSKDAVLAVVPAILAHEFQHMVHFNERVLLLGASSTEALWLSEGLAQMAEEVVARAYDALGDGVSAALFRSGTRARARRYLQDPAAVSLIVATGQGSLAERGAGFLFVLYLADQEGLSVLGRLTRTTLTGVANVESEVGRSWPDLLADWWSAIYLDGPGPESGPLVYPTVDLAAFLRPYTLSFDVLGPGDVHVSGSLSSSSAAYHLVIPPFGGTITVRMGGEAGGPSAPQSVMRMRVIRVS